MKVVLIRLLKSVIFNGLLVLLLLSTILHKNLIAQDTDSLWTAYNDTSLDVDKRLTALKDLSWKILFQNPDSGFVLADLLRQEAIAHNNPNLQALAYKNMGISHKLRGDYPSSLNMYNKGLEITNAHNLLKTESTLYSNIGMTYKSMGEYAKAEESYLKSIEIQEQNNFKKYIKHTYNNLGVLYIIQEKVPLALEYFQKSVNISEELNDQKRMAGGYQNIGLVYWGQNDLEMAFSYLDKSLTVFHVLGYKREEGYTYNNIGLIYKDMGRPEKAVESYLKGLEIALEIGDKENISSIYLNLGNIYKNANEYQKAFDYYKKSLDISSGLGNKKLMSEAYNGLGNVKNLLHHYKSGREYCFKAYQIANEIEALDELKSSCFCLKTSYVGIGDMNLSYKYLEEYHLYRDSIDNLENEDEVIKMTMRYEFEKEQLADSLLMVEDKLKTELAYQEELAVEKNRRNAFLFGGLLVLLIAAGLLSRLFFVRRSNKQLAEKNEIIELEKQRVVKLEKAKEQFFNNISHEFRTPLTLILGPIEELHASIDDERYKPKLGIVERNALHLQSMINELLSLSRMESGKVKLLTREENITKLIGDYLSSFESMAKQKNIKLSFESEKKEIKVFVDAEKIKKMMNNLLSNAFKFTKEGGKIKVSISEQPGSAIDKKSDTPSMEVLLKVTDTGIGIPAEKLKHVFDRFYQVESSHNRSFEGTGIGLALTKELIELHHGKIWVESEVGMGTSFSFLLPIGREHLGDDEIIVEELEIVYNEKHKPEHGIQDQDGLDKEESQDIDEHLPSILIVEDNDDMRTYIKSHLENTYNLLEACDGEEGFNEAITHIPDLIISDVMMPKMDGNEMSAKLKNDIRTSHIPIILLTARSSVESRIEGLETGADDYLSKPFNARELLVRIKNLVEQRKKLKSLFLKFASDADETNFKSNSETTLSAKDEYFINKAFKVVEEHMADADFHVDAFAREMALSRVQLHRKIKGVTDQSASDFIRTVRLKYAAKLLSEGSGNVTEVAFDAGFENLSWFTKIFRDQFGVSPSDYIKKVKPS